MTSTGLVVNVYERTYRLALRPGRLERIESDNRRRFDERVVLINNVDDPADARLRAEALVHSGEATSFAFVADHVDEATRHAGLPRRIFRERPYLLDFGVVMPWVVGTDLLLGWDPEVDLSEPVDWVGPAAQLLAQDHSLFSASPDWQARGGETTSTLDRESVGTRGSDFAVTWGFSDQCFLVRREELRDCDLRAFAPRAYVRHLGGSPGSFECRVEAFQRAARRARATYRWASYAHNDLPQAVDRLGRTLAERLRARALRFTGTVLDHVPSDDPRFRS